MTPFHLPIIIPLWVALDTGLASEFVVHANFRPENSSMKSHQLCIFFFPHLLIIIFYAHEGVLGRVHTVDDVSGEVRQSAMFISTAMHEGLSEKSPCIPFQRSEQKAY